VTVVAYGAMADIAEEAIQKSFDIDEILCEFVVPSQLAPLRIAPIVESVRRTGRLLVAEEGTVPWGFGAEVITRVVEEVTDQAVRAVRVGAYSLPVPNARPAEEQVLPDVDRVVTALRELV
jgi:pyruvate dehydrogenase E1 component beta subunit